MGRLPPKSPLSPPPHLKGLKFYISRQTHDNGVIEIAVREYKRMWFIFEGSLGPSFEVDPDGTIERATYAHDPAD